MATICGNALSLEVDTQNRELTRRFYLDNYLARPSVSAGWTGNHQTCDAGSTSQAFRDQILQNVNFFRAMSGVPANVTWDADFARQAQQAALMMSVNRSLDHTPPESWKCFSQDGSKAASNSNLSLGAYGPEAISGYMRDPGAGNTAVGHRRWILYPQTQRMGTGDIPAANGFLPANTLWVFDGNYGRPRPTTRDEFVAWPPPGYVPNPIVYPRWSFSLPDADLSRAVVDVTLGDQRLNVRQESSQNGYGENTLVWTVGNVGEWAEWPAPATDSLYRVTVDRVLVGGSSRQFTYDVVIFDPRTALPIPGDFDGDFKLTSADIDRLNLAIRQNTFQATYDLDRNGKLSREDQRVWVEQIRHTYYGDANLDGKFDTKDLISVFQMGQYEDAISNNSTWSTGDWDGNGEFGTTDFVIAFQGGGFERGVRTAVLSVPEPAPPMILLTASSTIWLLRRTTTRAKEIASRKRLSTAPVTGKTDT